MATLAELWGSDTPNQGLSSDLSGRLEQAKAAYRQQFGKELPITSGFRTREDQQRLYDQRGTNPNPVAKPGTSLHESGNAVDISASVPESFLNQFGIHRPMGKKDPVHAVAMPSAPEKKVDTLANLWESTPAAQAKLKEATSEATGSAVADLYNQFQKSKRSLGEKIVGAGEAGLTALSGAVAAPVSAVGGVLGTLASGKYGTPEGIQAGQQVAQQIQAGGTYQPRTAQGQQYIQDLQKAFEASKLPPMGVPELQGMAPVVAAGGQQAAGKIRQIPQVAAELQSVQPQPIKAVVPGSAGAAAVGEENLRIQRARELPIPIDLSRDQITRNPSDVRFARETAKDPVLGQPLQEHYAKQNDLIQKNLDHMIEETGAEYSGLNPVELGKKLVDVVEPKRAERKIEIRKAYNEARAAGEMNEPVSITPLLEYAKSHEAEALNAPVIKSLEMKISSLAKDGNLSLNELEEVRKMVGRLSQDTATNATYGREINGLIDNLTQDKGGHLYKEARKLNADFMTEFENTPIMKNITALKKGNSTQRAVAMEDLIQKSVIGSTLDDTQRLFSSLNKMGPEGQQMVNELKGAVAQRIKDQATKNVQLDINGKPYVSTPALNSVITDLDKSGKLDLLFGKKGAEHYRTLNQVTKEIQTVPKDTTNPSGTAAQIGAMLAEAGTNFALTGVPAPVATVGKMLYGQHQTKQKLTKIKEFVNYGKDEK